VGIGERAEARAMAEQARAACGIDEGELTADLTAWLDRHRA
jgi:hypothetical protein